MAPSKKKEHKIPVRTVPELAPKTFWRPHSCRVQDSNTHNQHVLIKNPIASQLPTQIATTARLNYPKTYMSYPKYNGMRCHRVVGRLPYSPLSSRPWPQPFRPASELSENRQFRERLSESDFDIFAFCRTLRKCVKALCENYLTKWWDLF